MKLFARMSKVRGISCRLLALCMGFCMAGIAFAGNTLIFVLFSSGATYTDRLYMLDMGAYAICEIK